MWTTIPKYYRHSYNSKLQTYKVWISRGFSSLMLWVMWTGFDVAESMWCRLPYKLWNSMFATAIILKYVSSDSGCQYSLIQSQPAQNRIVCSILCSNYTTDGVYPLPARIEDWIWALILRLMANLLPTSSTVRPNNS